MQKLGYGITKETVFHFDECVRESECMKMAIKCMIHSRKIMRLLHINTDGRMLPTKTVCNC